MIDTFDSLVFIGRFQPVHNGHLAVIRHGLSRSSRLIVLAGSAGRARSLRDPFTAAEREQMLRACLSADENARLSVVPLADSLYNDQRWLSSVQSAVASALPAEGSGRMGLIGHSKDRSSYYLRLFPGWAALDVSNHGGIDATAIRRLYFSAEAGQAAELAPAIVERVPQAVQHWLLRFAQTPAWAELCAEQAFVHKYQQQFAGLRYPPSFNTADAVVVQSGHVLLVRRGARPGLGLLALPGGFIQPDETGLDAALRELREETRLKVPEPVLRGSLSGRDVFDDPHRSSRGRTITQAFRFELRPDSSLPKVRGGDDAAQALWLPLGALRSEQLFEDHYFILQKMLGL